MWRSDASGPQGPMQVSAAAATDVGGGDRFDETANRAIGRAYLEQLYRRYHNWPDAIAAYNWGIGRLNTWLAAGRPAGKLAKGVAAYTDRVLRDSGLCAAGEPSGSGRRSGSGRTRRHAHGRAPVPGDRLGSPQCSEFAAGTQNSITLAAAKWRHDNRLLVGLLPDGFWRQLEAVINRTTRDLEAAERR